MCSGRRETNSTAGCKFKRRHDRSSWRTTTRPLNCTGSDSIDADRGKRRGCEIAQHDHAPTSDRDRPPSPTGRCSTCVRLGPGLPSGCKHVTCWWINQALGNGLKPVRGCRVCNLRTVALQKSGGRTPGTTQTDRSAAILPFGYSRSRPDAQLGLAACYWVDGDYEHGRPRGDCACSGREPRHGIPRRTGESRPGSLKNACFFFASRGGSRLSSLGYDRQTG